MGTNYYAQPLSFPMGLAQVHIGKSSAGWCFSLHVYPESGIATLDDWRKLWAKSDIAIIGESGDIITAEEMLHVVVDRSWPASNSLMDHIANHSEPGPRGLARHRLEDGHCIGHGEGPYDYIIGEFC
jgi:hypothetical protein